MDVFDFIVAGVLVPFGGWLALVRAPDPDARRSRLPRTALVLIAVVVGRVGGIYGVGGGSALAPVLIADGHPPSRAAPAAMASTFVTSVVGVVAFTVLAAHHLGWPPDWPTGMLLGLGGLAGDCGGAVAAPVARSGDPARPGGGGRGCRRGLPGAGAELARHRAKSTGSLGN